MKYMMIVCVDEELATPEATKDVAKDLGLLKRE